MLRCFPTRSRPPDYGTLLRHWRTACPKSIELVPTLVLKRYDMEQGDVFSASEMAEVCAVIKRDLKPDAVAVYDVMPNRDQGAVLDVLACEFGKKLIRVGIQPEEQIKTPFVRAVQDTWSGLCHGKTNDDWQSPGFGAETLGKWLAARNSQTRPVAWDLVAVAWGYSATQRGEYPGYDDAAKNMPLPLGRNRLAARGRHANRDGRTKAIYEHLKRGEVYGGYFSAPLEEIASIYRQLSGGKSP